MEKKEDLLWDQRHPIGDLSYHKFLDFFNDWNYDEKRYSNIMLHVPHSSVVFPEMSNDSFDDLDEEERLLIDYYTDELFVPEQETKNICHMIFPYCRIYCDVERLINDPLENEGLGISYSRWVPDKDGHRVLRSFSGKSEAFALYTDFHSEVSKKIVGMLGNSLLIDCHSFSALPNLLNSNPPDIDICIGYNDDETCPNKVVIGNIVQYFKSKGYKVGINDPFSNSKTFSVPVTYHSVMIEVSKSLYMDEYTLEKKKDGFTKLKQEIQSLYNILMKM